MRFRVLEMYAEHPYPFDVEDFRRCFLSEHFHQQWIGVKFFQNRGQMSGRCFCIRARSIERQCMKKLPESNRMERDDVERKKLPCGIQFFEPV